MEKTKLNIKQVLLTATVTCAFTIIAGVSTYLLTNKSAAVTYTVSSGPVLSTGQTHKRIYAIVIENTGRKEVEALTLQVHISKGSITEATVFPPPGVAPTEFKSNDTYRISLASLNPSEKIGASLMLTLPDSAALPNITVRGRGVNGQESEFKKTTKNEIWFLLAGAIASLMGAIFSVTPIMRRIIGRSVHRSPLSRTFLSKESSVGPFERNELLAFICSLSGLPDHAKQLRFAPSEISFRGAADFLISEALAAEHAETKQRFQIALQSMLLVGVMAEDSIIVIKNAITRLAALSDAECSEVRKHAVNQFDEPARLRTVLIDYILSKGTELPLFTALSGRTL